MRIQTGLEIRGPERGGSTASSAAAAAAAARTVVGVSGKGMIAWSTETIYISVALFMRLLGSH